jgi:hypothetical protein
VIANPNAHDTEPSLPRVPTLTPPPLPTDEAIEVTPADLVFDATVAVIAKGHARVTLAGALLDAYHALNALHDVAAALSRATAGTEDDRLPLEGAVEVAREHVRLIGSMTIEAARALDAQTVKP